MKIAIAQINPVIADIEGNFNKIRDCVVRATEGGARLVVFPELATIGYPPLDMLDSPKLIDDNLRSIERIARLSRDIAIICGYVDHAPSRSPLLYNAAAFMNGGALISSHPKTLLPTYDVFDEMRYFVPAPGQVPVPFEGRKIGITICEDIWNDQGYDGGHMLRERSYDIDPVANLMRAGADIIINISASPFVSGKNRIKWRTISQVAMRHAVPVLYVNQVGGNDSLVFDGNSFCVAPDGAITARAAAFREDLLIVDDADRNPLESHPIDDIEEIRMALVLGLRDYVNKCGFTGVVLGLSGGIDSALVATLAVQALGPSHVRGVTMPSIYSSAGSVDDSIALAKNLGIRIKTIPIAELFRQYRESLAEMFQGMREDVTEENIQARIRGNLLMSISNKFGCLLLTTGNKSELAMGYCTLYGDMSGGLCVISDLPKTMVYRLARHINRDREIIPWATIDKPPSAELRENQKDEDSLPPYAVLDQILERFIERRLSAAEIIADGFDPETVHWVLRAVMRNEYKRLQAPPGLKVTSKAFGYGRRIPIVQRFVP